MKNLLANVWRRDARGFVRLLILNIGVALMSSISIVMLVPMLDLLEISVGDSGGLLRLLQPFSALPYLQRAAVIIAVFVVLMLIRALLNRRAAICLNIFMEQYTMDLRSGLYDAVRHAGWETLTGKSYADLINLFTIQCRQACLCLQGIINLIASAITALMQLSIAIWMSLPVTLMVLAVGSALLMLFRPFLVRSKAYGRKMVEVNRDLHRETQNQLSGIKEIRAYGVEESHKAIFDSISQTYFDTSLKTTQLRVTPQLCYSVAAAALIALAFAFSVLIMDTGTAQLVVLVYIFSRLWPVFSSWQEKLQTILSYLPAYETIQSAIAELSLEKQESMQSSRPIPFSEEIAFEHVGFRYGGSSEAVLEDVSFTLPCGTVTALVGPSGAGKSTTADLLLGLLTPREGQIKADGYVLKPEDLSMWRKNIGYIPQEPLILNATVRENLQRFHPDATEEEMISALEQSLAWGVVQQLPQGLDAVLGDKGVRLSGGERQRIVLARVLMGKPRLIILDEATSALDYESETFVRETIHALRGKSTVLIIAHRLATIRGADRAIVLENGRIAEQGSLEELLHKEDGYLASMSDVE